MQTLSTLIIAVAGLWVGWRLWYTRRCLRSGEPVFIPSFAATLVFALAVLTVLALGLSGLHPASVVAVSAQRRAWRNAAALSAWRAVGHGLPGIVGFAQAAITAATAPLPVAGGTGQVTITLVTDPEPTAVSKGWIQAAAAMISVEDLALSSKKTPIELL